MKKSNMNGKNINDDNEERWGRNQISPVDEEWGWIRSTDGSANLFITKGLWAYARRTLSCDNPMDPPTIEVRSLDVLAANKWPRVFQKKTF